MRSTPWFLKDIMSALLARTGRHRQRYEDGFRLVAGCIPYRQKNLKTDINDLENGLEVLMISSPNRHDLVFPKGGWEDDETKHQAACREALEEAGVSGTLNENELGVWVSRSKSRENSSGNEGYCRIHMFALKVTEELEFWAEKASHERRWLTVTEAYKLCRYDWMQDALKAFMRVMSEDLKHLTREDAKDALMAPPASVLDVVERPIWFVNASVSNASTSPINAFC